MFTTILEKSYAGIPALHICKQDYIEKPLPTVIFWHGFTSAKEHNLPVAYQLASKNIRVILPDALHHGTREGAMTDKERLFSFWSIVLQSVQDTKLLYDTLTDNQLIDNNRIFLSGTSMGGIITCGTLAAYPFIKGGAVFMGSPAWEKFARQQIRLLEQEGSLPLSENEAEEQVRQLVRYDITQHDELLGERPLFFWHGQRDEVVSYEDSFKFYTQVKKTRKEDSGLVYHLDKNAGHKVTRSGMLTMTEWMADHI
ncbi:serine aminopeptidase domain-containing protein [Bacillus piscicola]|uniref:serine aminopeptidase domain-containing protein n=1 Tax=Bacillus piscicola TaxID=1632684 RepID=UPI001F08F1C0|nr:alpha/beta hydrolase [Bacillus piscicola]